MTLNSREAIAKAKGGVRCTSGRSETVCQRRNLKNIDRCGGRICETGVPCSENITLDKTEVNMKKGERVTLHVTYDPEDTISDKTIIWNVADPSVATVENGTVTAIGGGETGGVRPCWNADSDLYLKSGSSAGETYIYRKQRDAEKRARVIC